MVDIPTLETERLRLRPHRPADFDDYARMWADPEVVRFIGGVPFTREQSWTRFLRQTGMWHHMGFGFWALEHKSTGAIAGECGFHEVRRALNPPIEGTMEAGWGLTRAMQGQGLAEEAMRAAIGWAAQHGTGEWLTAIIDLGNGASRRVAAKLGFRERGPAVYNDKPLTIFERPRRT